MQSVYLLIAIVCNVAAGCVEFPFEGMEYETRRDCMEAAREAERENRGNRNMERVEFDCKHELVRK